MQDAGGGERQKSSRKRGSQIPCTPHPESRILYHRLLIVCEYPTLLGGERSLLATLSAVAAAGFAPSIAAPPEGPLADAVRERRLPLVAWQERDQLESIVRHVAPDLLHANSLSTSRLTGPIAAAANVPSVGHLRDIVGLSRQAVADVNCHRRLIAVSEATRQFHVDQGIDPAKCVVVSNGIDLETYRPRPATGYLHRELQLPPATRFVVTIGQLGLRKGTDVALAAARQVAGAVPNVHWLIIGERTSTKEESREFERDLQAAASQPPLAGRVHFLGTRDDVPELLPECTLLLHAARQEPLGRVLLEAAAGGTAVVATDVGGTREIYPTPDDGALLVAADDPDAMSRAMLRILRDESYRDSLGQAARRRATVAFDAARSSARLIEQYQAVL